MGTLKYVPGQSLPRHDKQLLERTIANGRLANLATKEGTCGGRFRIRTPLISMTKAEIIRTGHRLGVDFSLTHSCYDPSPEGLACGSCDSCLLRARGFNEATIPDPTPYIDR